MPVDVFAIGVSNRPQILLNFFHSNVNFKIYMTQYDNKWKVSFTVWRALQRQQWSHKEENKKLNISDISENFSALQDYVWRKKTRYQNNDKPGGDITLEVLWDHAFCPGWDALWYHFFCKGHCKLQVF